MSPGALLSGRERDAGPAQGVRVAGVDRDAEVVVHTRRAVDGDPGQVLRGSGHAVQGDPRRAGRERLVAVVDVAVAVEEVHRTAEVRRLTGDLLHDRLERVVVRERRVRDGRVEHVGLRQQYDGLVVLVAGLGERVVDALHDGRRTVEHLGRLLRRRRGLTGPRRHAVVAAD